MLRLCSAVRSQGAGLQSSSRYVISRSAESRSGNEPCQDVARTCLLGRRNDAAIKGRMEDWKDGSPSGLIKTLIGVIDLEGARSLGPVLVMELCFAGQGMCPTLGPLWVLR